MSATPDPTGVSPATRRLTLGVLTGLVLLAGAWGTYALPRPSPRPEQQPACVEQMVRAGDSVFRDQVVVSVFNGSNRNGLAALTQESLTERGFAAGETGNGPRTKVTIVRYQTKCDPAVRLVGRQFGRVRYVQGDSLGAGVTVIVGQQFQTLRPKGPRSVTSKVDTTICAAPSGR